MRALILWAEPASTNLGVRTLARGTERLLERAFPGIETAAQGFGQGDAPVRIGDWRGQVKRLAARDDVLVDWVRGFDLVVDTRGGDSFSDIYGMPRLATMGLMTEIANRAKVPVFLGPQTIGPFKSLPARLLARRSLGTARAVLARDAVSAEVARGLTKRPVQHCTDVVFALGEAPIAATERDVIVNVSGLLWTANPHVDHERYRAVVTVLCQKLVASGRRVSLLAHVLDSPLVDNDVTAVRASAELLGEDFEVLIPTDLDDVRSMLASAQVVIGSRMHACLNALSVGRPAIPLAYSRKFAPLLGDLGWDHTIDLRDSEDPVEQVLAALEAPGLAADVVSLKERAIGRIERAKEALEREL